MKTRIFLSLLSILFSAAAARAELKWEQTSLELHPAIGEKQAIGHFKYQNVGKTPVRFKSVHASCGCTAAQSQKEQVPPGEKGEITATFTIGDRTGTQVKTVTVETDETPNASMVLTMKTVIPDLLSVAPTFVYWKNGEEAAAKSITVKAAKDYPAKNVKVTSSSPEFSATVEPGKGAGEWTIKVQPKQTSRTTAGVLTIQPEVANGPAKMFYANMSVTAPP